jgi:signal transduction histidine kinase
MKLIAKIYLAFASILIIFSFVTVTFVIQSESVEENIHHSLQSAETLRLSQAMQKAIVDTETGLRGYLISENESFLEPYYKGLQNYEAFLPKIREQLETRNQLNRLAAIDSSFRRWQVTFAKPAISLQRLAINSPDQNTGYEKFKTEVIKKGVGKKITDGIRQEFDNLEHEEMLIRDSKIAALKSSINLTETISIGLTVLSIVVGIGVVAVLAKVIKKRLTEISQLANSVALGQFDVQIADLSNDEISEVSNSLNIMAKRLDDSFTNLQKKNQELDQFAYVVSHDLKAPLRAINSLAEWIEEDLPELEPDVKYNLELMRGRVYRMENLINGILEYSKVGRKTLPVTSFPTSELIAEVIDLLAPESNISINVNHGMPDVTTERILLSQVFANLIGNAIKYNDKPTPLIRIGVNNLPDGYEFWVSDNGPGIAEEYHQKVFGIFQTMESRDIRESTGIGLAIVKKIIDEKGGNIRIESKQGEGSTFIFYWPVSLIKQTQHRVHTLQDIVLTS